MLRMEVILKESAEISFQKLKKREKKAESSFLGNMSASAFAEADRTKHMQRNANYR